MPASPSLSLATATVLLMQGASTGAGGGPPVAPVREARDVYFGKTLVDPYRWMEDEGSTELAEWTKGQNAHARAKLDALQGRSTLHNRLLELDAAGVHIQGVQRHGGVLIYAKYDSRGPKLVTRNSGGGRERVLIDPAKWAAAGSRATIDFFRTSWDGEYVAFGYSMGGSEQSIIRVVEVRSGKLLQDAITRCRMGHIAWHPDGRSFFYLRLSALPPGAPPSETLKRPTTFRHVLFTNPDADKPVLGQGFSARVPLADVDFPYVFSSPGSDWLIGVVSHGARGPISLYVAPLASLAGKETPWRKLVDPADEVEGLGVRGDEVFLLSSRGAPRFRILSTSLAAPDLSRAEVVVPETAGVITDLAVAEDGLYYQEMPGGPMRLWRLPRGGRQTEQVSLPVDGALFELFADPREPGVLVGSANWTLPPRWLVVDGGAGWARDARLVPAWRMDFAGVEELRVIVPSADGVDVPLTILRKRGLPLDKTHPTRLIGYGAYGISLEPAFDSRELAWLERGGVVAYAHVRGGGERGVGWHRAGQKATKMRSVADFIACAEYLIAQGYTSPRLLFAEGASAGGMLVGRAMTERPELFGAVLFDVGLANPLRFELTQGGPANVAEFGTATTPEGFLALLMADTYHHVQPGARYPAILITAGTDDVRLPFWQSAKLAARLQAANPAGCPVLFRAEKGEGHQAGHQAAAVADKWSFLLWQAGDPEFQPARAGATAP